MLAHPSDFESEPAAQRVHLPWRRTEDMIPSACTPSRFPGGAGHLPGLFSRAEGGGHDPHAAKRALVSSEAPALAWFTFRSARGIRTRTTEGLSPVPPASWARAP